MKTLCDLTRHAVRRPFDDREVRSCTLDVRTLQRGHSQTLAPQTLAPHTCATQRPGMIYKPHQIARVGHLHNKLISFTHPSHLPTRHLSPFQLSPTLASPALVKQCFTTPCHVSTATHEAEQVLPPQVKFENEVQDVADRRHKVFA